MRNRQAHQLPFLLFVTGLVAVFSSCDDSWRRGKLDGSWSSVDPLSIPIEKRSQEFQKGNLVANPSFEKGNLSNNDTTKNALTIENWEFVGDTIAWVRETENGNYRTDGDYVVKINRSNASENDSTGCGILSDFIPVIPGNYELWMSLKLSNISNPESRLGTKIYRTVNIRMQYFDKNKKPVSPLVTYPYTQSKIDAGFKGYGFSNFWAIDTMSWVRYFAHSYNYPFSEGDMPDGTSFVRIFIGLKGNGTLWVDNVNMHYSKWNFTPLERMDSLMQKSLTAYDLLLPTPKRIGNKQPLEIKPTDLFAIVAEANAKAPISAGIELLQNQLIKLNHKNTVDLLTKMPENGNEYKLIFEFQQLKLTDNSAYHPQGYSIRCSGKSSKHIEITANDAIGLYYAASTLAQLTDTVNNVFFAADIEDWPDFTGRSFLLASWNDSTEMMNDYNSMQQMSMLRFNKAYIGYGQTRNRKNWYSPDQLYKQGVARIGDWCKTTGTCQLAVMVNPYYHFDYEMKVSEIPDSLKNIWIHDEKGMKTLSDVFKISLDAGATTIMLMADDFVPHEKSYRKLYSLWSENDKEMHRTLAHAQAYMINFINKWLSQNYPDTRFEFCPPWYLNEFIDKSRGMADGYFDELISSIPKEVAIIWTGNTVRSLVIDEVDLQRYMQYSGRTPMLWDNTIYARSLDGIYGGYPAYYPEKSVLCNLFEPYDVILPNNFQLMNDGGHMYVNGSASSEIYKIKYATLADYLWNTQAYNPEKSLWKVLVKWYGSSNAYKLLQFNDSYFKIVRYLRMSEYKGEDPNKYARTIEKEKLALDGFLNDLSNETAIQKLKTELFDLSDILSIRIADVKTPSQNKANRQI
jgi:hypothetical protein